MIQKEIELGSKKIEIILDSLAKQSNGAAVVKIGQTTVLATVVMSREPVPIDEQKDFLPLSVDYRERTYATGKIPGGWFKREGRPREKEILMSRIIDRSIRPLFPKNFQYQLQVSVLVLSSDGENDADVIAIIGTSTALMVSNVPFETPIGCVRVGRLHNEFIINPTYEEQQELSLDMVVSGTGQKIVMIELNAEEIPEQIIIDAIEFAKPYLGKLSDLQLELRNTYGVPKISFSQPTINEDIYTAVKNTLKEKIPEIFKVSDKLARENMVDNLFAEILSGHKEKFGDTQEIVFQVRFSFEKIFKEEIRKYIIEHKKRPDGRTPEQIRDIFCSVGFLPRTHGSALFTRGQTQAIAAVTLGTPHDMQIMEELEGEYKERFLFHYNFPGFATGSIKPDRGPGRREIGHGALAKRALYSVLPTEDQFPYTIRIVSDIIESNGSSSMASVCAGSLALFDAGVPVKKAVSGIALGLIKEGNDHCVLTDILGLEDRIGDMDFKVAGTSDGITALQLDVKTPGIELTFLPEILNCAKSARLKILESMNSVISKPKETLSDYAPRMVILQIPQAKIGGLIGPGGKNIRQIIEETNTKIDIEDDGRVFISGVDPSNVGLAKQKVEYYTAEVVIGKIYQGKVTRITDFGAFVEILPGKEGLVHISQLANNRVESVRDVLKEDDEIAVKVIDIDEQDRIVLSKKLAK